MRKPSQNDNGANQIRQAATPPPPKSGWHLLKEEPSFAGAGQVEKGQVEKWLAPIVEGDRYQRVPVANVIVA
jgi:hypothetical protein